MSLLRRLLPALIAVIIGSVPSFAFSQLPLAWTFHANPALDSVRLIRGPQGDIYVVTVGPRATTNALRVIRLSPNGAPIAQGWADLTPSGPIRHFPDPIIKGNLLVCGLGGNNSLLAAFDLASLSTVWEHTLSSVQLVGVHSSGPNIVTTEQHGNVVVRQRSSSTGEALLTTGVIGISNLQQSTVDPLGNVYLAGYLTDSDTSFLARINSNGAVAYVAPTLPGSYTSRSAGAMAFNAVSQQVVIGYEAYNAAQPGQLFDAVVVRAASGNGASSFSVLHAFDMDLVSQIFPTTNGDNLLTVLGQNSLLNNDSGYRIIRQSSVGGIVWESSQRSPGQAGERLYAFGDFDSLGNLIVARTDPDAYRYIIEKWAVDTGSVVWRAYEEGKPGGLPGELGAFTADVASTITGNPVVANQDWVSAYQGLLIGFERASVVGGTMVLLQIQLTSPTPAANLPVSLSSNAPELPVPATTTLPLGATSQSLFINTLGVTATKVATVNVRHSGFIAQRSVSLLPPVLSTFVVNPAQVRGGMASQGTVSIIGDAPTGGWTVTVSSANAAATVPASVTIPSTQSSVQFQILTTPVAANTGGTISASRNGVTRTAFMAVNAPALLTFTLGSTSVRGGQPGLLTLTLDGAAPVGGFSILLVSGMPSLVILPSSTSVPAGSDTANLNFATASVTANINVTLIAYRGSVVRTRTLTLTP